MCVRSDRSENALNRSFVVRRKRVEHPLQSREIRIEFGPLFWWKQHPSLQAVQHYIRTVLKTTFNNAAIGSNLQPKQVHGRAFEHRYHQHRYRTIASTVCFGPSTCSARRICESAAAIRLLQNHLRLKNADCMRQWNDSLFFLKHNNTHIYNLPNK